MKKKRTRAERDRLLRQLQRSVAEETQAQRNAYRRARIYYIEVVSGNADALEDAKEQLAVAIENGAHDKAITIGSPAGMVVKLNALLDRPESQSHAVGLLLNAADQVEDFDTDKAAAIRAMADSIDGAVNAQEWRDISTIKIEVEAR